MKTIHNSQSIRSRSEGNAIRDTNLNPTAALVLILINRYINHNPDTAFDLTGEAASERWTMLTARQINNSIAMLRDNGYIKVVTSNELFTSTRTISSTVESDKSLPKQKTIDNDKKAAIFDKVWVIWKKKTAKKSSMKLFLKLKVSECELVLGVAKAYNDSVSDSKYVMQLDTYIRNNRWEDVLDKPKPQGYQSVVKRVTPVKTEAQIKEDREYNERADLKAAEFLVRRQKRTEEFGWARPFPNMEDKRRNSIRVKHGGINDVELELTNRLKRQGDRFEK
tara:strand:+ start:275 stop:1114 length:840 start_codon:yes stop_codon:yes gene_type:complete